MTTRTRSQKIQRFLIVILIAVLWSVATWATLDYISRTKQAQDLHDRELKTLAIGQADLVKHVDRTTVVIQEKLIHPPVKPHYKLKPFVLHHHKARRKHK